VTRSPASSTDSTVADSTGGGSELRSDSPAGSSEAPAKRSQ
jgi:hypothetical protein